MIRKMLFAAMVAASMSGIAPSVAVAAVDLYVNVAPPPPRYEAVPAPRRGYVWAPGYWDYKGKRHVWVKGNWQRERAGYRYSEHRWVEDKGRWRMERGGWDRDHDGVPNNRDRHPDNPRRN